MNLQNILKLSSFYIKLSAKKYFQSLEDRHQKLLLENGINPIIRVSKTENGKYEETSMLGAGGFSSVYEVEYNGKRMVAKITTSPSDGAAYSRLKEIYDDAPSVAKKHLPIIYNIIKEKNNYIILMEYLIPLNIHLEEFINPSKNSSVGKYKTIPNETLMSIIEDEAVKRLNRMLNINLISGLEDKDIKNILNLVNNNINSISDFIINVINSQNISEGAIRNKIIEGVSDILKQENSEVSDQNIEIISSTISNIILDNIIPLKDFPESHYHEDKIKHYKEFPETKSLLITLNYLIKKYNFKWNDLNRSNIMERPKTRDIVISDFGKFQI